MTKETASVTFRTLQRTQRTKTTASCRSGPNSTKRCPLATACATSTTNSSVALFLGAPTRHSRCTCPEARGLETQGARGLETQGGEEAGKLMRANLLTTLLRGCSFEDSFQFIAFHWHHVSPFKEIPPVAPPPPCPSPPLQSSRKHPMCLSL